MHLTAVGRRHRADVHRHPAHLERLNHSYRRRRDPFVQHAVLINDALCHCCNDPSLIRPSRKAGR